MDILCSLTHTHTHTQTHQACTRSGWSNLPMQAKKFHGIDGEDYDTHTDTHTHTHTLRHTQTHTHARHTRTTCESSCVPFSCLLAQSVLCEGQRRQRGIGVTVTHCAI